MIADTPARGTPDPTSSASIVSMPWDPVRDLLTMQERFESLFGRSSPGWVPAADLCEVADRFLLTLELPGVDRADI